MPTSRGLKNNNPGNLIKTAINWLGKVSHANNTDSRFEQFTELKFGVRAMIMDIQSKIKSGKDTIAMILPIYAPAFENNTAAYIASVEQISGINRNTPIDHTKKDQMGKIIMAMSKVENGTGLTSAQFDSGWSLLPSLMEKKSQ